MAVDDSFRDRGIGGQLIERGIAEVAERGGALVWCNGRTSAGRFYERHGFERRGEEFIVVPSGPHYVFVRRLPAPIIKRESNDPPLSSSSSLIGDTREGRA